VFAKVAEFFAEFLWVQQFSTQKLLLELAEIPKSENCIGIFFGFIIKK
jgi:hypothetical protein